MKNHWLFLAIAALFIGCSPAGTTSDNQVSQAAAAAEAETGGDIPRTPGGKPDFNGIWQVMMNANDNLEPAAPKAAYQLVSGDFVPRSTSGYCGHGRGQRRTGKLRGC